MVAKYINKKKMVLVVDSMSNENADLFLAAVDRALAASKDEHPYVAFDCEGLNLCRAGTVEIIALHFGNLAETDDVFLVDLEAKNDIKASLHKKLKELFESKTVIKVVHDVRMDSDALFHLHGITIDNVHDTQCYHAVLTGREDVSLNDMLSSMGIDENVVRNKSIYKSNPNFWVSRPLTEKMKEWASGDVEKLLAVAKKQAIDVEARGAISMEKARSKSAENCKMRVMKLERHVRCMTNIGRFIGPKGINLRNLQKRTGTMVWGDDVDKEFMIFYNDHNSLNTVKHAMGY